MKFKTSTKSLSTVFQLLDTVVLNRSPRPTLSNVKIETKNDKTLEISGTDSEIAVRYILEDVIIDTPGIVSIPSANIATLLKETSDQEISFSSDENRCEIQSTDGSYRFFTDDPHNFPFLPFIDTSNSIPLPYAQFVSGIRKTIFAAAKEKTRFALNGLYFNMTATELEMVATDGKRLSKILIPISPPGDSIENCSAILPKKAMDMLDKINITEDEITFEISDNLVQFNLKNITICAKLVEGSFPNYHEVIPTGYTKQIKIDTDTLSSAVRRASLFTSEESRSIMFCVREDVLIIESKSEVSGEAKIQIPIEYSGEDIDIVINPEFLGDVLRVSTDKDVCIEFMEANKPLLIRCGENYCNVIMPISPND